MDNEKLSVFSLSPKIGKLYFSNKWRVAANRYIKVAEYDFVMGYNFLFRRSAFQ